MGRELCRWLVCFVAIASLASLPESIADSTPLSAGNRATSQKKVADKSVAAVDGKQDGGVRMEDVSEYSSLFLSGLKTLPSFTSGDVTYRFELEEPSNDDKVISAARQRIGETPEVMEKSKKELIQLLKNDAELNAPLENDAWVTRFLRLKNYDVQKAYELIKGYYKFKAKNRFIYDNLVPSELREVAEQKIFGVLPKRDQLGRRTLLFRIGNWNPAIYPILDGWRMSIVLAEIAAYEPATQISGAQIIFDMNGLSWQHIWQIDPTIASKMVWWFMFPPVKYEGIHFVNQPYLFGALFSFFRPFLTKDLKSKIHFHGNDVKSLHRYISPSSLPDVYGGTYTKPDLSSYQWDVLLKSIDEEYAKLDSYGMKRNAKAKKRT